MVLHSLLDKYPWERYERPYTTSYSLNNPITVLLENNLRKLHIYIYIYMCVSVLLVSGVILLAALNFLVSHLSSLVVRLIWSASSIHMLSRYTIYSLA